MALSFVEYTGDGASVDFIFNKGYILEEHVRVLVDKVLQTQGGGNDYTFFDANTIRFNVAPADQTEILLERRSGPDDRIVEYSDASRFDEEEMNTDGDQSFFLAQEALDRLENLVPLKESVPGGCGFDFQGCKAFNAADGTDGTDLVTVQQVLGGMLPLTEDNIYVGNASDVAVPQTPAEVRDTLDLEPGIDVQQFDQSLEDIKDLVFTAGAIMVATGPNNIGQLAASTDGFFLSLASGTPVWVAFAGGLPPTPDNDSSLRALGGAWVEDKTVQHDGAGGVVFGDGILDNGVVTRDPTFAPLGGILIKGGDKVDPREPLELDGTGVVFNAAGGIFYIDHTGVGSPDSDKEFFLKLGPQQILSDGRPARALHRAAAIPELSTESATDASLFNLVGAVETTIVTLNAVTTYVDPAVFRIGCHLSNTGNQTVNFVVRIRLNAALVYESESVQLAQGTWLFQFTDQMGPTFVVGTDVITLTVEADSSTGNRTPQVTGSPVSEITLRQLTATGGGGGSANIASSFYFGGPN